jgi:cytochrome c biogenesis protein CcdA
MSKIIAFILTLVMIFSLFGCVTAPASDSTRDKARTAGIIVVAAAFIGILSIIYTGKIVEADNPDDEIKMVSAENEIKTDSKSILNVLQHVEVGVSPEKDVYVGLRFQMSQPNIAKNNR